MGSLHDGHLALIDYAKRKLILLLSVFFVNPTQFNEIEDFNHYPRNENQDIDFVLKNLQILFLFPRKKKF